MTRQSSDVDNMPPALLSQIRKSGLHHVDGAEIG